MKRRARPPFVLLALALCLMPVFELRSEESPPARLKPKVLRASAPSREMTLRVRIVCLPEEMHRRHGAALPTNHEHIWGCRDTDGKFYTLLRGKFSEAIFLDEQLREKELLLKVRLFPKSQVVEVTHLRSIRQGVAQDLYYYCDVCVIKAVSPEPCACCQGPMELIEKPLSKRDD